MIIMLDLINSFNPLLCLSANSVESQRISCNKYLEWHHYMITRFQLITWLQHCKIWNCWRNWYALKMLEWSESNYVHQIYIDFEFAEIVIAFSINELTLLRYQGHSTRKILWIGLRDISCVLRSFDDLFLTGSSVNSIYMGHKWHSSLGFLSRKV